MLSRTEVPGAFSLILCKVSVSNMFIQVGGGSIIHTHLNDLEQKNYLTWEAC